MTTPTAHGAPTLADFAGTIVLVGAGKMGGAMLDAWLALGLPPASVVVIEPQPAPELTALSDLFTVAMITKYIEGKLTTKV